MQIDAVFETSSPSTSPLDPSPAYAVHIDYQAGRNKSNIQHIPLAEGNRPNVGDRGCVSPSSSCLSESPGARASSSCGTSRSGNAKHEHEDDISSNREKVKRLKTSRRGSSFKSVLQPGAVYKGTICIPGNSSELADEYLLHVLEWDEIEGCLIVSHSAYGDTQLCHLEVGSRHLSRFVWKDLVLC